jgi:pimeloyl-ACP methyl ester carboxylesterase
MFEMVNIEERSDSMSPSLDSPPPPSSSSSKSRPIDLRRKKPSKSRCIVPIIFLLIAISSFTFNVLGNTVYPDQVSAAYLEYVPEDYPKYNEQEALENIYYSKVAFCTEHAIKSWSCGDMCERAPIMGKDKIRYIPEGERFKVQGYVAQIPIERVTLGNDSSPEGALSIVHDKNNDTKCMVSFRGSLNGSNWYANFLAMLRPWPLNDLSDAEWCPGCKAHYGFAEAYDELRDDVHTAITELNCTRLVLSGHSLGAAIAMIASFDLRSAMGYKVDATWTFGKPRIGNTEFVNSFEAAATEQGVSPPMWRVVHYHDPVPRAPPTFFGMHPVAHGGLEIYYTDRASSEYIVCPQYGAIENQSDACMGGWPLYYPMNMDHVTYLNQSFAFKDFPDECKATE